LNAEGATRSKNVANVGNVHGVEGVPIANGNAWQTDIQVIYAGVYVVGNSELIVESYVDEL